MQACGKVPPKTLRFASSSKWRACEAQGSTVRSYLAFQSSRIAQNPRHTAHYSSRWQKRCSCLRKFSRKGQYWTRRLNEEYLCLNPFQYRGVHLGQHPRHKQSRLPRYSQSANNHSIYLWLSSLGGIGSFQGRSSRLSHHGPDVHPSHYPMNIHLLYLS